MKADGEGRTSGKWDENHFLERFFSVGGEKGAENVSADFVDRLDEGDAREKKVGPMEELLDQKPSCDSSEQQNEDAKEDQREKAGDEEGKSVGKGKMILRLEPREGRRHDRKKGPGKKIEQEDDHHDRQGDRREDDEACEESFLHLIFSG
jgi:hypothetical protein